VVAKRFELDLAILVATPGLIIRYRGSCVSHDITVIGRLFATNRLLRLHA
jgi:hypothetical protein